MKEASLSHKMPSIVAPDASFRVTMLEPKCSFRRTSSTSTTMCGTFKSQSPSKTWAMVLSAGLQESSGALAPPKTTFSTFRQNAGDI